MSQTSSYRAYVTAMKAKIDEADRQATVSRRKRGRAVDATGKTMATLGTVAAGLLGVAVLARSSKTTRR